MNERDNPEVLDYLRQENRYLEDNYKHLAGLIEKIYGEITGRLKPDEQKAPFPDNGYYYYTRYDKNQEHPIYCRKKGNLDAKEGVLLNVNAMAKGYDYYNLKGIKVSPDNRYVSFGVDTLSRRIYIIYIKDLMTNKILPETISNAAADIEWANDSKNIYYTTKDSTLRPDKVYRHTLFTNVEEDEEIYHEIDNTYDIYLSKKRTGRYILIISENTLTTEIQLIDADDITKPIEVFSKRQKEILYYIEHSPQGFYILTNWDAINFKIMECPEENTSKENWREYIKHRNDVFIESISVFKDFLVLEERANGLTKLRIINAKEKSDEYLNFNENAYVAGLSKNHVFDTHTIRYNYQSLTTPSTIYDYNINSKQSTLVKKKEVIGDFNSENYKMERIFAIARDGKSIPVSIVYRKDKMKQRSANPLLLYGYGSYGYSGETWFNLPVISLLDHGFIYAIAHIRGGADLSRPWYEEGKLLNKKNTFTDFIDVSKHLIEKGYTSKDKLCIYGGSAGGMLIGAVINMEPELYKAAVATVPFVDVVTTMLDETIPLTTEEYNEWGNPNIKKYYDYMLSYSPYDNIQSKEYPALLVTTGLHDSQVQYWEPAKWVAKLRELKTGDHPLYLFTDMDTGHSEASGRYRRYKKLALIYTFFLNQVGYTNF